MSGRNAFVKQFKQFNGSPPAHTRGRPDDRERSVKLFAEVQKIYRECSPAAAKEMCRLALEAEDERVRSVCLGMVMDRAWGRPREYDPNAEAPKRAPPFDEVMVIEIPPAALATFLALAAANPNPGAISYLITARWKYTTGRMRTDG